MSTTAKRRHAETIEEKIAEPKTSLTVQPIVQDELLVKLMSLDGKGLRLVFDNAVSDLRNRQKRSESILAERLKEIRNAIDDDVELLQDLEQKIKEAHARIDDAREEINDLENVHSNDEERFADNRIKIEKLEALFRPKLTGFED